MTKDVIYPVFYDRLNRRWKRFKALCLAVISGLVLVFGTLLASTLIEPDLPALPLAQLHGQDGQLASRVDPQDESFQLAESATDLAVNETQENDTSVARPEVIGFYVNWDSNSFTSLKKNLFKLDKVIAEWLHLTNSNGSVRINDPDKLKETVRYIKAHRPDLAIVPLINNFVPEKQLWDSDLLDETLGDPSSRKQLISNLLEFVRSNQFAGISIDFENVAPSTQPSLLAFMTELYGVFQPLGLEVSQSVVPDDPSFDLRALGQANDYVILMAYDEYASSSNPGPVASMSWFNDNMRRAVQALPEGKAVVGIGGYGYDWTEGVPNATTLSFQRVLKLTQQYRAQITMNPDTLNPGFRYTDAIGQAHQVWFLDAITAFNQLKSIQPEAMQDAKSASIRGFALWRLGTEDPSLWDLLADYPRLDPSSARHLERIHYGYDLEYRGKGEVLKVTSEPSRGRRFIQLDNDSGLVTEQRILAHPSPYVISRWGGEEPKNVSITFDDGPDATYTPQILDILKDHGVQATFFIIGQNANRHEALLKRMVREGHTIGNHTYQHTAPSTISATQLRMELNASARLLESYLGRRTLLFRPPYGEDIEPATPGEVNQLAITGRLGYYTMGMHVDTDDWRHQGVDQIVKTTIDQVVQGLGNVVLLHDGGGDRRQTIAALPALINGLRERGYRFVGAPELIGVTRDELMPSIEDNELVLASVNGLGFRLIGGFSTFIFYLFMLVLALSFARVVLIITLALYENFKPKTQFKRDYTPRVSVVIPAFNEEKVIVRTVEALLRSTYDNFNVLIIDDGSNDRTYSNVHTAFEEHPQVQVLRKESGGKSRALNFAIERLTADIIVTIDADTQLAHDAIEQLVRHFSNPKVAAVAGNIKVGNRRNLITRWQALEYIISQNLERRAMALLNCIFVVPGAIGAWRIESLIEAGGFTQDTLAEDADLTLRLLRMGYKIEYEQAAIAFTEAPDTVSGLLRQRYRWTYGVLQTAWKHRHTLFRPRHKGLGMFAIPNVLIVQVGLTVVAPFMDLLMLTSVADAGWRHLQDPGGPAMGTLQQLFIYYLIFLSVDFLASSTAFMLERKEPLWLLLWLIPQRFFYRQLMYVAALRSLMKAIHGSAAWWGSIERKATVLSEFSTTNRDTAANVSDTSIPELHRSDTNRDAA